MHLEYFPLFNNQLVIISSHPIMANANGTIVPEDKVSVIIVPFPAQGHLNQMLQLSCLISSFAIPVHYVGSAVHNRQARSRANGLNPKDFANIYFHDLPMPPFASPPPNPNVPNKFPAHLQPAWEAALNLRHPLADYARTLSSQYGRIVVIHDGINAAVVADVATIPNAETYAFNCLSAFCQAKLIFEQLGKNLPLLCPKELPPIVECISDDMHRFLGLQSQALDHRSGDIYNTSRIIEPFYLNLLDSEEISENRKGWAIGPILPSKLGQKLGIFHECLNWLDKQEKNSVIYVTFGTTTSFTQEEIHELALGLELSNQKFIWVVRAADRADIFDKEALKVEIHAGFEDRVRGRGMVVRDWVPQPEILAHPATGGFMSHCGWNSCVESMVAGVPIATWPMHSDQPTNAVLVTELLKIGLEVREWGEVVKAAKVADVVRRLMATEEGDEIRKRSVELAKVVAEATGEGGASRRELEGFIAHVSRPVERKEGGTTSSSAAAPLCYV